MVHPRKTTQQHYTKRPPTTKQHKAAMSSQSQRQEDNPLTASMRSVIFSSRWTDADLVFVLGHAKGDFDVAVDTILRHEATGQPPEELIRLLSGTAEGRHFDSSSSPPPPRPRWRQPFSHSQNSTHSLRQVGLDGGDGPVAFNRSVSEGGVPSCVFVPPSSTSLLEREGTEPNALSRPFEQQQMAQHLSENTRGMLEEEQQPGVIPASASSSTALVINSSQTEKNELSHQMRTQRHDDVEVLNSRQQQMLQLQSGIEASLKESGNTDEAEALSYAVKASRETFDKECLKQELHSALEKKMIKMKLAESLSDPVKKSEEELIDEALRRSLTDPVPKSEEQLFEEAMENSLRDIEIIESICKAEEELVEEAMRKSLHTMSKEEELIEAVKRHSLKSMSEITSKDEELIEAVRRHSLESLSEMTSKEKEFIVTVKRQSLKSMSGGVGKKPTHARVPMNLRQSTSSTISSYASMPKNLRQSATTTASFASMPMNLRQSTSTTFPLSFADDDISECSSGVEVEEHPPLSRLNSPLLKGLDISDVSDLDRKMPALVEVELEHPPPSRFDSPLLKCLDISDISDLDRKMPALVLPAAAQTCYNYGVISSVRNSNVASELSSADDQEAQDDNSVNVKHSQP
jgi:hypothetical protein